MIDLFVSLGGTPGPRRTKIYKLLLNGYQKKSLEIAIGVDIPPGSNG